MSSSPGIFDQNVVARPCRAGCRVHVHASSLSAGREIDRTDLGANLPEGWTAQTRPWSAPRDDLMWFMCNSCEALVSELDVEGHRCAPA